MKGNMNEYLSHWCHDNRTDEDQIWLNAHPEFLTPQATGALCENPYWLLNIATQVGSPDFAKELGLMVRNIGYSLDSRDLAALVWQLVWKMPQSEEALREANSRLLGRGWAYVKGALRDNLEATWHLGEIVLGRTELVPVYIALWCAIQDQKNRAKDGRARWCREFRNHFHCPWS